MNIDRQEKEPKKQALTVNSVNRKIDIAQISRHLVKHLSLKVN